MLKTLYAVVRRALARLLPGRSRPGTRPSDSETRTDGRPRRVHADREDDLVVFVVGMRVGTFWKVHQWLPVLLVGRRLDRRLRRDDESGLLGSWTFASPPRTVGFVQYWESFDALRDYAHDSERGHVDAWRDYEQGTDSAVGVWHETYRVDDYETVYNDVPPRGLGLADDSELVPATGALDSAAGRIASPGPSDESGATGSASGSER